MRRDDTIGEKLRVLEREAAELGFDGFGVSSPETPRAAVRFREWLGQEFAGEMAYMRRGEAKRCDLQQVLPGVKSVICLRTNYFTRTKNLDYLRRHDSGDISVYALNEDYHPVILRRLERLEACVRREFPECVTRIYVDTGPILEKPLAQQAGLGWIGKHANLISEGVGSWYFLSEILTDVPFQVSAPAPDRCGTCRNCIDICPTQAIVAPYVLDARRCISYLTIELKGVIPVGFRKAIGNRIYGCDDCQIVCPWNGYAVPTPTAAFHSRLEAPKLADWMRMDEATFRARFRDSPILRIKRRGLLRNLAVALGNSGDRGAAPVLLEALRDDEPLIRAHVVWALGELLGAEALPAVRQRLVGEKETIVLDEIRRLESGDGGATTH
jgi:epoxyqueuosine reductase